MIFNLFSKRQKKLRGDVPDVYVYDSLPNPLRVQIIHILNDTLGETLYHDKVAQSYRFIVDTLCREYGLFNLPGSKDYGSRDYYSELANFFLQSEDIERTLDTIELSFRVIDKFTRDWHYLQRDNANEKADNAINELNERFREHGVGYQFIGEEIVRVDSELIHSEVVKPALRLLNNKEFAGAQEEFLKAHEHYRHGNEKEALVECLKSFESLMKAICEKRRWPYKPTSTAKDLIEVCFANDLIPSFWQTNLSSLRSLLESSIPTGRNKLGGHGQGTNMTVVPSYLVAYMLHMTASVIVFLGDAEAALP